MPKLCIVTSSRADYGLLYPTMLKLKQSKIFQLQLIVTGSHLAKQHGNTIDFIKNDGFKIDKQVDLDITNQTINNVNLSASNAIKGIGEALQDLKPNALLLLGDRYEILCAAMAAGIYAIPVVHFHGGEITEGANDDMFRHAITKLSALHFVSTQAHKKRVIQLGETPKNVVVSGALGIEGIRNVTIKSKQQLAQELNIVFRAKLFLVTYHPETLNKQSPKQLVLNLLHALNKFKDVTIVITKANADVNGELVNDTIEKFIKNKPNFHLFASLGQVNYFSIMKQCDLVIGNSSSGIIESPAFKKVNINIGSRQKGRAVANNNLNCKADEFSIYKAIKKGLRIKLSKVKSPYDRGLASDIIIRNLVKQNFEALLPKRFYDLK